jgi:hypothetical protein
MASGNATRSADRALGGLDALATWIDEDDLGVGGLARLEDGGQAIDARIGNLDDGGMRGPRTARSGDLLSGERIEERRLAGAREAYETQIHARLQRAPIGLTLGAGHEGRQAPVGHRALNVR